MAKAAPSRKNLFGIGERHYHYKRSKSGEFVAADKRTPKRKATAKRATTRRKRAGGKTVGGSPQFISRFDPGSRFESKKELDRFERSMRKWPNPKKKRNDVIDDVVGAAEGITSTVYQGLSLPAEFTHQAGQVALRGKDALKRKLGINGRKKKKNSAPDAERLYEKFHGKPSEEVVVVTDRLHFHEHLATLGVLMAVVVDTPTGLEATITFDNPSPYLCSSEDGKQLYIEAGNQELDLASLGMDGEEWVKDRMVIGEFAEPRGKRSWNITYRTNKEFDQFEEIDYQHDLGEPNEGKRQRLEAPYLEYEPRNKRLYVTGGNYRIEMPWLGMSPGIEN